MTLRSKETRLVNEDSLVMAGLEVEKTLGPEAVKDSVEGGICLKDRCTHHSLPSWVTHSRVKAPGQGSDGLSWTAIHMW